MIFTFLVRLQKHAYFNYYSKYQKLFICFVFAIIVSAFINMTSIYDSIRFLLTFITPVVGFTILVYDKKITERQIKYTYMFFVGVCIIQFFIALYNNLGKMLGGIVIIDDLFRGTMGAYQFVFLLNLYSIYVINKYIILRKISIIELILTITFLLSFIISGAGGYLTLFVITIIFILIYSFKESKNKIKLFFRYIPIVLALYFVATYFFQNYFLAQTIYDKFILSGINNNPKLIITLQALEPINNMKNIVFGLGPGQYLSGIGGNYNATFYGGILLDEMGSSAYAVNSDFFALLSEVGILGLFLFYISLYSIVLDITKNRQKYSSNNAKILQMTFIGVVVYSVLLSFQYRVFISFVSSNIIWFFLAILRRMLVYEEINIDYLKNRCQN